MSSRDAAIAEFAAITNLGDEGEIAAILESHGWDLHAAIDAYISGERGPRRARPESAPLQRAPADSVPGPGAGGAVAAVSGLVRGAVRVATWPLDWLSSAEKELPDGTRANAAFRSHLELDFDVGGAVEGALELATVDYAEATKAAAAMGRFLLLYLHSGEHERTKGFCDDVLRDGAFAGFSNANLVFFGADVRHRQGCVLQEQLQVMEFPFLCLAMCHRGAARGPQPLLSDVGGVKAQVLARLEGRRACDKDALMALLTTTMAQHQGHLDDAVQQVQQQARDAELRAEQEVAFQSALEADRRRREEAEREQERQAALERERERAARRAAEEERARREEMEAETERKRSSIMPEPPQGEGAARIRLQLPNGAKLTRRFGRDETVGALRAFVAVHSADEGLGIANVGLSTTHPKRDFDDDGATLEEAGLYPMAMLFVRDLDA